MMTMHLNPLFDLNSGLPFNAHNDFVRFFFEGGLLGLLCYVAYGVLLCRWAIHRAATREGLGLAAALVAMLFLTAGTTELSLHTANLYTLYGMLALVSVPPAASGDRLR
jgi:O-antigen ligase